MIFWKENIIPTETNYICQTSEYFLSFDNLKDCSDITFDREHQRKNCMVKRVDEFGHTTSDMGYGPKIDT